MPKKRIAVITDSEQRAILRRIAEVAFSLGCHVAVFTNIYNHWVDDDFSAAGAKILTAYSLTV